VLVLAWDAYDSIPGSQLRVAAPRIRASTSSTYLRLLPASSQQRLTAISKTRSPPSNLRMSPVSSPRIVAMRSLPASESTPMATKLPSTSSGSSCEILSRDIPTPSLCRVPEPSRVDNSVTYKLQCCKDDACATLGPRPNDGALARAHCDWISEPHVVSSLWAPVPTFFIPPFTGSPPNPITLLVLHLSVCVSFSLCHMSHPSRSVTRLASSPSLSPISHITPYPT
jgi:hypothetical protein